MASLHRRLWYAGLVITIIVILAGGWWVIRERPKRQLINFGQTILDEVPKNPHATLINRRYDYCASCTFIGIWEIYATNLAWNQVVSFYRDGLQGTRWECSLVVNNFGCVVGTAYYPQLAINYNLGRSAVWYDRDVTRRALATGETVYLVHMVYVENQAAFEAACPPGVRNAPNCQHEIWSTDYVK